MATVTFDNASRVYAGQERPAVDNLNIEVGDGEFLVLVGPSGSGKSTALRMLAGLEEIDAGRILIGDRDVTDVPPKDRDIAMVFQNYALYPHMTVADNMGFALKIAGNPKAEIRKRVEDAAEILDLTEYLDRKPKALSGGQRQRVAMGRAIVRSPQVFLMDEPLSNLDAKLRVATRTQIASLRRRRDPRGPCDALRHRPVHGHRRRASRGPRDRRRRSGHRDRGRRRRGARRRRLHLRSPGRRRGDGQAVHRARRRPSPPAEGRDRVLPPEAEPPAPLRHEDGSAPRRLTTLQHRATGVRLLPGARRRLLVTPR